MNREAVAILLGSLGLLFLLIAAGVATCAISQPDINTWEKRWYCIACWFGLDK